MQSNLDRTDNQKIGCYLIHNPETGEAYVGSGQLGKRFSAHISALEKHKHSNRPLQRAYNRNPNFEFIGLETRNREEAYELEQAVISEYFGHPKFLNRNYDVYSGAHEVENSTREKMSVSKLGKKFDSEHKTKIAEKTRGQWMDPEFRAKMTGLRAVSIAVEGKIYASMNEACRLTSLPFGTLQHRLASSNFPEYKRIGKD